MKRSKNLRTSVTICALLLLLSLSEFAQTSTQNEPPLKWITGNVQQILVQPGEQYYVFTITGTQGTLLLRIAAPHTCAPITVNTGMADYDLLKEAYFRSAVVEVGYRDFGNDPQAGSRKLCIDRVRLSKST